MTHHESNESGPEPLREPCCPISALMGEIEKRCGEYGGVFRKTSLEFLKEMRKMIDRRIEEMEAKEQESASTGEPDTGPGGTKIEVE